MTSYCERTLQLCYRPSQGGPLESLTSSRKKRNRMASSAEEMAQALCDANTTEAIYRALVDIRTKLIKQPQGIDILRQCGGLRCLLNYITRPNMQILNISLSILGNCCLNAQVRKEVKSLKGIPSIVTVLKGLETASIQNRACRTLANLALDKEIAKALHEGQAVSVIVSFLDSSTDSLNQQTAIRALRILADTPEHRDEVIRQDGLKTIAEQLTNKDVEVVKCALKAMALLTENCTKECAKQLYPGRFLQCLVVLANHKELTIRQMAVSTLVNLAHDTTIRPYLGSAGAVRVFIKETIEYGEGVEKPCGDSPVFALCLCTIESVNRRRIRSYKGLAALMVVFKKEDQSILQDKILEAFMNFYGDSEYLKEMQSLGIITNILEKLHRHLKSENELHHEGREMPRWQLRNKNALPVELPPRPSVVQLPDDNEPDDELQDFPGELEWTDKPFRKIGQCHPSYVSEMKKRNRSETKTRYHYLYNEDEWKNSFQFKFPMPDYTNNQHVMDRQGKILPCVYVPEWHSPERSPPMTSWDEDFFFHGRMFYRHRSPRSLSPMSISPSSSTPCYSPCEFSEEENEDEGMGSETEKRKKLDEENWRNVYINDDNELEKEKNASIMETANQLAQYKFNSLTYPKGRATFFDERANPSISRILSIMKRCAQHDKPTPQFFSSSCIEALLTGLLLFPQYKKLIEDTLLSLSGNKLCLEAFLLMHLPDQMNSIVLDYTTYSSIIDVTRPAFDKMNVQFRTTFGQGEIERVVAAGTEDDKLSALLMVPFIHQRHPSIVKKFFLELNGLETMLAVLSNPAHDYFDLAVRSCSKLLDSVLKEGPSRLPLRTDDLRSRSDYNSEQCSSPNCIYKSSGQPKDVEFVLETNERVKGNRAVLSKNCEVFNVMLEGSFSEASCDVVQFGEASRFALEYVVHFLHGCDYSYDLLNFETRWKHRSSALCPLFNESIDDLFEVFLLADRLLIPDLQNQVFNKIVKLAEDAEKAVEMYNLAMSHMLDRLAKFTMYHVNYYFQQVDRTQFLGIILRRPDSKFPISELRETLSEAITNYEEQHLYRK